MSSRWNQTVMCCRRAEIQAAGSEPDAGAARLTRRRRTCSGIKAQKQKQPHRAARQQLDGTPMRWTD